MVVLVYEWFAKLIIINPRGLLTPNLRIFHHYYASLTFAKIAVAYSIFEC